MSCYRSLHLFSYNTKCRNCPFYPLAPAFFIAREVSVTRLTETLYNPGIDYKEGSRRERFVTQKAVIPRRRTVIANKLILTAAWNGNYTTWKRAVRWKCNPSEPCLLDETKHSLFVTVGLQAFVLFQDWSCTLNLIYIALPITYLRFQRYL